jgi:hypothetical protein
MKVRNYGFEIETTNSTVGVDDLLSQLEKSSGYADTSTGIERRIYLDSKAHADYYIGLVVTVKDQKMFCKLENDHGHIKITVENLKGKDKLMEFNFFAINKKNGIGIYQHYYQSCGLNVFGKYLRQRHNSIRDKLIDDKTNELKSANGGKISEKEIKAIKAKHSGVFKFSPLLRKETLAKMLKAFKTIKAFEFEYATLEVEQKYATPLSKYVKKKREKLSFSPNWSLTELATGIVETIKMINPKNGRVHVVNEYDEDIAVKIFEMPDNFGEEEYDDVAFKLNDLDVYDFAKHEVSTELINICKSEKYNHIFEANPK